MPSAVWAYYDCLACHNFNTSLKSFCALLAYDILHRFGLWRASDGRKAISQISLHGRTGLAAYWLK